MKTPHTHTPPDGAGDAAVRITGMRKRFGDVDALQGLDLVVRSGEMYGLVGPDGAGKTTTIRILCGIVSQDEGAVEALGCILPKDKKRLRTDIGYLSQRFSLYEDLSIDENVAFFADIHRVRGYRQRRDELLEMTRLAPFRSRLAGRLSGGMKQKLALACTLIHRPRLLLLDEPTTGVDPVARREFWKLLSEILRSGVTILMTTPYLDEAERCTRIGLLSDGKLLEQGTPEAVKGRVEGQVVEVVSAQARRAARLLADLPHVRDLQLFGDRLNVLTDDAEATAPAIRKRMEDDGLAVEAMRTVPPTLENAFIALLRRQQNATHQP